ncbi:DNA-binding transcriptional MerR regulator [Rhodococcus sp. 27YEA15]|uniref:MerR family transcriptional regulator n=1 Tax=Rhodococcus sp. 27YEA15 TaxID=3156259 RepID=UPI003C7EBB0C
MPEYRIDDLARVAGTTSRNVRAYQERGLLPPPEKRGRVGIYTDAHLARLKLVDSLLQRGFTTAHIADFIIGWENGKDLGEVLGLEDAVTQPWTTSEPARIPLAVAREFLGDDAGEQFDRLVQVGVVEVEGEECIIRDTELLAGIVEIAEFGFTPRELVDIHVRVHTAVDAIAKDLIGTVTAHIRGQHGPGWLPEGDEVAVTADMLNKMRALGVSSVHSALARALDQNLQRELGDHLAAALDLDTRGQSGLSA